MSVLKRRSNNIKDGQYVIAFSSSRALIDISKDCGMTWTRKQPSDLTNVNEYFFSNDKTRIAMSGDGRHIYCSCYMANVGLLRSTDFLETAEPFKPDNCYSVNSIACNDRGNLVAIVCKNNNNKYDLMLSGDYGKTWTKITDSSFSARTLAISYDGKYMVIEGGYSYSGARISADYGKTWALKHSVIGNSFALGLSSDGKYAIAQESSSPYRMFKSSDYLGSFTEINTAPLTSGIRANYRFIIMNKNRL